MSFYDASFNGDLKTVQLLVAKQFINASLEQQYEYIAEACRGGHLEISKLVISKVFNIENISTGFWINIITGACYRGNLEMTRFLISTALTAGAKINKIVETTLNGAFYSACQHGQLEIVKLLLELEKEEKKSTDYWQSSLNWAYYGGHLNVVRFLEFKLDQVGQAEKAEKTEKAKQTQNIDAIDWNSCFYHAQLGQYCQNNQVIKFLISKFFKLQNTNILANYYKWPSSKEKLTKLLYLQTPLDAFQHINGFQELHDLATITKQAIKGSNMMIPELLNIVSQYIII